MATDGAFTKMIRCYKPASMPTALLMNSPAQSSRIVVACFLAAAALSGQDNKAEIQARKAMDEFMTAFNSRDPQAWAATLNYPHVRFASNEVRVYKFCERKRRLPEASRALAPQPLGIDAGLPE